MYSFRVAPCCLGHLACFQQIYCYLKHNLTKPFNSVSRYSTMKALPNGFLTPLIKKDHQLDINELLVQLGVKYYQSLIGALQWLVSLGCFEIHLGVATMSSFLVAPRVGHLDCFQQIYGYLKRNLMEPFNSVSR